MIPNRFVWAMGCGILHLGLVGFSGRPSAEFDFSKHAVPLDQIISGGPPKDGIPATLKPEFIPADEPNFLQNHDQILGVMEAGTTKAYPFFELKKINRPLQDRIHGHRIQVHFNAEARSAFVLDTDGKPIPTVMAFWFAWYPFHPETDVLAFKETDLERWDLASQFRVAA